jgi:hypothetical protein
MPYRRQSHAVQRQSHAQKSREEDSHMVCRGRSGVMQKTVIEDVTYILQIGVVSLMQKQKEKCHRSSKELPHVLHSTATRFAVISPMYCTVEDRKENNKSEVHVQHELYKAVSLRLFYELYST